VPDLVLDALLYFEAEEDACDGYRIELMAKGAPDGS
jgi:hypothetical protein